MSVPVAVASTTSVQVIPVPTPASAPSSTPVQTPAFVPAPTPAPAAPPLVGPRSVSSFFVCQPLIVCFESRIVDACFLLLEDGVSYLHLYM